MIYLLAIIALSEVLRLVLTHKPLTKKGYFKQKKKGVEHLIFDLEFKKFKTKEIREDIRAEYAQAKSRLQTLEEKIKREEPDKDKDIGEFNRLADQKVLLERDIGRYEKQMEQLDAEVSGAKPSSDYPDGIQGIDQQLDSLMELKEMLNDWIKSV